MIQFVLNRRQALLSGELLMDDMTQLMAFIQDNIGDGGVELLIASGGGRIDAVTAAANLMVSLRKTHVIRTLATGSVASAAVLLMAAGTRGHRIMLSGASLMVHENSWTFNGLVKKTTTEWEDFALEQRQKQNAYWDQMAYATDTPGRVWRDRAERKGDVILDFKMARDLRIVDDLVPEMPPALGGGAIRNIPRPVLSSTGRRHQSQRLMPSEIAPAAVPEESD